MRFCTPLRNARAELIETMVGTSPKLFIYGSALADPPTNGTEDPDPSPILLMMELPSDWESSATLGGVALNGTWSGTPIATGTPLSFRLKDSTATITPDTGTTWVEGTCSTDNSGELIFDGNITEGVGQTITIDTFGIMEGNG